MHLFEPGKMESTVLKEDPSAYDVCIDQDVITFIPKK